MGLPEPLCGKRGCGCEAGGEREDGGSGRVICGNRKARDKRDGRLRNGRMSRENKLKRKAEKRGEKKWWNEKRENKRKEECRYVSGKYKDK